MSTTLIFACVGCLGGLSKSLVGIFKAKSRKEKIKLGYIVRTLKLSVLSGTIIGAVIGYSLLVSFIAGYIGSDILEGAYLSFQKTKLWKKHFDL
jgi:hypothetical protein